MVAAGRSAAPVTHDKIEVHEPALHLALAIPDLLLGPFIEADRGESRHTGETFLGSRVDRVHAPDIDLYRCSRQGGDGIHYGQAIVFVGQSHQGLDIGLGTGGCLGMDEGHDLGIRICLECIFQLLRVHRAAPGVFHHDRNAAAPFHVLLHPSAEDAVLTDDYLVTRFHQVDETGLHAG